ncbi:hypothetical protein FE394_14480 [Xenorhabdus sp. Reich]|uniref:Transmembrane protein n=1 Tax=Xenorhabdus littoralis TaxID=2582835 RepID=A0ABU4SP33_9GAMM|nr:BPSS1780 family membrane protein [Xenorhabdus sp. Reich]MDX8000370.1 hypothetical protein [Xenorhabdus sp. Reich]
MDNQNNQPVPEYIPSTCSNRQFTFIPNAQSMSVKEAILWIGDVWGYLISAQLGMWVLLGLTYSLIILSVSYLPYFISLFLIGLLEPVLLAGVVMVCEKQRTTGRFEFSLLFYGFENKLISLITVGIIASGIKILGSFILIINPDIDINVAKIFFYDPDYDEQDNRYIALIHFFSYALSFILSLACSWFAPALIIINNFSAIKAIKTSLSAVRKNFWQGVIFFLCLYLLIYSSLLVLLIGLLFTLPLYAATHYSSYRSVFYQYDKNAEQLIDSTNITHPQKNIVDKLARQKFIKKQEIFISQAQSVDVSTSVIWIGKAWDLVMGKFILWILTIIFYNFIIFSLKSITYINFILPDLLEPVFIAGFIAICQKQVTTGKFEFELLFSGFKQKFGLLLTIGIIAWGIKNVGLILTSHINENVTINHINEYWFIQSFLNLLYNPEIPALEILAYSDTTFIVSFGIMSLFMLVSTACFWFVPALVTCNNLKLSNAILMSLNAVRKNFFVCLLFCLFMTTFFFVSFIPPIIGALFIKSLYIATYYTSYRSVFYAQENKKDEMVITN